MEKIILPLYLKDALGRLGKTEGDLTDPLRRSLVGIMAGAKKAEDRALMAEMFLRKHFRMKELTIEDVAQLKKMGKALDRAFEYCADLVSSWRTAVRDYYDGLRSSVPEKEALKRITGFASKDELNKWKKG